MPPRASEARDRDDAIGGTEADARGRERQGYLTRGRGGSGGGSLSPSSGGVASCRVCGTGTERGCALNCRCKWRLCIGPQRKYYLIGFRQVSAIIKGIDPLPFAVAVSWGEFEKNRRTRGGVINGGAAVASWWYESTRRAPPLLARHRPRGNRSRLATARTHLSVSSHYLHVPGGGNEVPSACQPAGRLDAGGVSRHIGDADCLAEGLVIQPSPVALPAWVF